MSLSDSHSIEFKFEDLDIEIDGLIFAEVFGVAELAANGTDDGEFYVKHITLDGDRRGWDRRRFRSHVHLYRPVQGYDARTLTAHLFRAIETALYRHAPALEAWQAEVDEAKP